MPLLWDYFIIITLLERNLFRYPRSKSLSNTSLRRLLAYGEKQSHRMIKPFLVQIRNNLYK